MHTLYTAFFNFLEFLARQLELSTEALFVILFLVILPLTLVILVFSVVRQRRRIKALEKKISKFYRHSSRRKDRTAGSAESISQAGTRDNA